MEPRKKTGRVKQDFTQDFELMLSAFTKKDDDGNYVIVKSKNGSRVGIEIDIRKFFGVRPQFGNDLDRHKNSVYIKSYDIFRNRAHEITLGNPEVSTHDGHCRLFFFVTSTINENLLQSAISQKVEALYHVLTGKMMNPETADEIEIPPLKKPKTTQSNLLFFAPTNSNQPNSAVTKLSDDHNTDNSLTPCPPATGDSTTTNTSAESPAGIVWQKQYPDIFGLSFHLFAPDDVKDMLKYNPEQWIQFKK